MLRRRKVNVGMRVSVAIRYVSKYCLVFVVLLINYVPYHVFYVLCAFLSLLHVFPFCFPFSSPCLSVNFMSLSQGYMRE